MSDANRVAVSYEKESAYGVAPASALEDTRYTGESLTHETNSVSSAEIRDDRQVADVTRVGVSASGDTNHELSYAEFDDWIESSLLSATWTASVDDITSATTVSVAAGTGVYTTAAPYTGGAIPVGSIVEIRGSADPLNNGYHVITASTTTTWTIANTGTGVTAAEDLVVDILSYAQNGTTFASYTIQKQFVDLTNIFHKMPGGVINGWNLDVSLESIVTMSFSWIGKRFTSPAPTSTLAARNGTTSNAIMNSVDNVPSVGEGPTHTATDITAFGMALSNNARPLGIIGLLGANDVGLGKVDVTGTLQLYFEDNVIYDKYTGDTASEQIIVLEDAPGNGYVVYLPQTKYASGAAVVGGQDTDVIGDFAYTAYRHATYDYTVKVARFAA